MRLGERMRWSMLAVIAAGPMACLSGGAAQPQGLDNYPQRTVTMVVTVQAGSQADVFARTLAKHLTDRLGRTVVVENRVGGGQTTGAAAVARAAPDGYTLLYGNLSALGISPQLRSPPPYNVPKDFAAISFTVSGPSVLVVNPALPIKSAADLVAYAKANPGKLNIGNHGAGSYSHVAMARFQNITGTEMVAVPYNGGGPLMNGFLTGSIELALLDVVNARPQIEAGKARIIAQLGSKRSPLYADVPLVSETVAPDLTSDFWLGVVAPAGTPANIIARLNREIVEIMKIPSVVEQTEGAARYVSTSTPAKFGKILAREWDYWGQVVRDNNLAVR